MESLNNILTNVNGAMFVHFYCYEKNNKTHVKRTYEYVAK